MTFLRNASSLFLLSTALVPSIALAAPVFPPTDDPTYGIPAPKNPPTSAAQWIWAGRGGDNQTVFIRRGFDLKEAPKSAKIYITADDYFEAWVNGKSVASSQPDPDNNFVWQDVHILDVAPLLTAGHNVIAVRALNTAAAAGVIARLELPGQPPLETDTTWKATSTEPTGDWKSPAFKDAAWTSSTSIAPVTGGLWASNGGLPDWPSSYMARITLPFDSVADSRNGKGKIAGIEDFAKDKKAVFTITPAPLGDQNQPWVLLDFGKEVAGRVVIEPLTTGKVLAGTGESREEALQSPWGGLHNLNLTPGQLARTPWSAFRYVRLVFPAGTDATPVRFRVSLDHKYYPVDYKGSFNCSDPLLTKIWWTGAYTAHLSMQEDIWDAPKRDRARWIGDAHVSGEIINNVFADKFLMERLITIMRDEAQGGRGPDELPSNHVNGIPGYSAAWVCTLADFHRHQGDQEFLAKQHQPLITLLSYMKSELDERGVFANKNGKWPFTDWSPEFNKDTPLARMGTHLFYAKAAQEGAFLLREMGDTANADQTAVWADSLKAVANKYLLDGTTNTYSNRLQANAMAIYSGVATKAQTDAIYAKVLNPDSPSWNKTGELLGNNPVMSPYYGNYIIFAMSEAGHNADTMREIREFWGGMLAEGATTMWEAYDPKWQKDDFHAYLQADDRVGYFVSLCHGWSAGPTNWLTERVLGIRSTGAAFKTAQIAPDLGDLQWAEGDVPTPTGIIHARAENKAGKMSLELTVPAGTTTEVSLPGTALTVNGAAAKVLRVTDGRAFVSLPAGKYSIAAQ